MTENTSKVKDTPSTMKHFTYTETNLRPILLSMKIFGIYFDPAPGRNKVASSEHDESKPSWTFSWLASRLYCYLVLTMLWFNFVRMLVALFPLDHGAPLRTIMAMWYLQCAITATIMVDACHKLQRFQFFYKHWDSTFLNGVTNTIDCKYECTLKYTLILSCICWVFSLTNSAMIYFVTFQTHFSYLREISENMVRPFKDGFWCRLMVDIFVFYETGIWTFPVIFVLVVSSMIRTQFLHFKRTLSRHIEEANGSLPSCLAELRSHFLKLSGAVEIINETFKWILGFSLLLAIFMACFTSYQLISNINDTMTFVIFLFWLVACFLLITLLTLSTAGLHEEAQSSLGALLATGTKDATSEQIGQLNLFLTKLSASPVGFTVVDFFLITKEFLLTVGGFYLTYFFLILQFQIS